MLFTKLQLTNPTHSAFNKHLTKQDTIRVPIRSGGVKWTFLKEIFTPAATHQLEWIDILFVAVMNECSKQSFFFLSLSAPLNCAQEALSLILSLHLSSRCSRHPDTRAGPRHLIGWLGQQQFPGADLPTNPPDSNVSHRGLVAAYDR